MLSLRFALLLLAISLVGCATAKPFEALDTCVPSSSPGQFLCVDSTGNTMLMGPTDLICFKQPQFKAHEETCHGK